MSSSVATRGVRFAFKAIYGELFVLPDSRSDHAEQASADIECVKYVNTVDDPWREINKFFVVK